MRSTVRTTKLRIVMAVIRYENPDDYDAVRELNRTAFEGEAEAQLVDGLRNDGAVILSLVAVEIGSILGHILFSALAIENETCVLQSVSPDTFIETAHSP